MRFYLCNCKKKDKTLQKWAASEWFNHRTDKQRKQTSESKQHPTS